MNVNVTIRRREICYAISIEDSKMAAETVLQSDVWNKKGTIIIDGGLGTEVDGRGFSIYVRIYS